MSKDGQFSHIKNGQPSMVDVSHKRPCARIAQANSFVKTPPSLTDQLNSGDIFTSKGPVFATAIIAGTMAVKNTASLIPFCHTLIIDHVSIDIAVKEPGLIAIECLVATDGKTGVEMEAMVGASIAALTIYDMCKAVSNAISVVKTTLVRKTGGKNDFDAASA
jgi:cyclic pyranopterin phosphate synthase